MSDDYPLTPAQQLAWLNYMRVHHRVEYELNRQLQTDSGLSMADYTVLNTLSHAPGHRMQLRTLATVIGWERSRLSHHLLRMTTRGLVDREASESDGRGTVAVLTQTALETLRSAAPTHAAWVRRTFFADLDQDGVDELTGLLAVIYEGLLREGTLPRPEIL